MSDMSEDECREQFRDLALSSAGLSAEPETFNEYCDAIIWSPEDRNDPRRCKEMSTMSSCGLFALRAMDRGGVAHEILRNAYDGGHAIENVETILRDTKASRGRSYRPKVGDFVLLSNDWHVMIITKVDGDRYETTQGGERRPDRAECIETITRTYYPATKSRPANFDGRPVTDVGDCVALAAAEQFLPGQV